MTNLLPISSLLVASLFLTACGEDAIPGGEPKAQVHGSLRGDKVKIGVLVAKKRNFHWIQAALTGWSRDASVALPREVNKLKSKSNCNFTPPAKNDLVRSVHFSGNGQKSPVHWASKKDIALEAKKWVRLYKKGMGYDIKNLVHAPGSGMSVVDVVVTDKSKPIYLTLTTSTNVIWNIHSAVGVEISNIALIGNKALGIVNAPKGTNVEVLSVIRCKPFHIARKPKPHWGFVENELALNNPVKSDIMKININSYLKFSNWHRQQFKKTLQDAIVANEASHVLVGPLPSFDDRVKYRPILGSTMSLTYLRGINVTEYEEWKKLSFERVRKYIKNKLHLTQEDLENLSKG